MIAAALWPLVGAALLSLRLWLMELNLRGCTDRGYWLGAFTCGLWGSAYFARRASLILHLTAQRSWGRTYTPTNPMAFLRFSAKVIAPLSGGTRVFVTYATFQQLVSISPHSWPQTPALHLGSLRTQPVTSPFVSLPQSVLMLVKTWPNNANSPTLAQVASGRPSLANLQLFAFHNLHQTHPLK